MSKTILTMEDLVKFCEEKHFQHFSASESGYELAVKIPATFEVDDEANSDHRGMLRLKYKLYHLGKNLNNSFVSEESAKESLPTIAHRPVLAYIHQLENGEWDFYAHNMEMVENEDGEQEIHYLESQVGAFSGFPDEQPYIEYDEETGKDFVFAYAYIPEEYTKAADIIRRKGGTKNSVELRIEEMSYDAKEKCLKLDKFYVDGSTLLGSDASGREIKEGMQGSRADIADFKAEPVMFETNLKLVEALDALNKTLSRFNINNQGKEEKEVKKNDLDEAKVEEFDLTDGEGGAEGGDTTGGETTGGDNTSGETTEEETTEEETTTEGGTTEGGTETSDEGTGDTNDDPTPLNPAINDDDPDILKKIDYAVTLPDGTKREYSLSLTDKMRAMYELVNASYGEEDWYDVEMYEEDGYIEMFGWWGNHNYRQQFTETDGSYSLVGERIEIFEMYVTAEQKERIEQEKIEFAEMKEKLQHYEEEPDKMEILNSEDYSKVSDTKEFEDLKLQTNHFEMSIEEVREKADAILLEYAKHGEFSLNTDNAKGKGVKIPVFQKKVSRYGDLFSNNTRK